MLLLFSLSVMSDSLQPHELWHPRLLRLLELAQTLVHRVSDDIQPSRPLSLLLLLPSVFSHIKVFSNELALCIRWPKYWSFSLSISPAKPHNKLNFKAEV